MCTEFGFISSPDVSDEVPPLNWVEVLKKKYPVRLVKSPVRQET